MQKNKNEEPFKSLIIKDKYKNYDDFYSENKTIIYKQPSFLNKMEIKYCAVAKQELYPLTCVYSGKQKEFACNHFDSRKGLCPLHSRSLSIRTSTPFDSELFDALENLPELLDKELSAMVR